MTSPTAIEPSPPAGAQARRGAAALVHGSVLAHGSALLLLMLVFRLEKLAQLVPRPSPVEWILFLLPDVGFVLLFEASWLLAGRLAGSRTRLWQWLFLVAHGLVYLDVLVDHVWLLHTGTRLHLARLIYSVRYFGMLLGLLATGFDAGFAVRAALTVLCFLLAIRLRGKLARAASRRGRRLWPAAALLAGAAITFMPTPLAGGAADLWSSPPVELFGTASSAGMTDQELGPYLVPPRQLYREPRLVGPAKREPPNVVFVVLESTRRDVVPPYAEPPLWDLSPTLAGLAGRAVVVDDAYAVVTHTSKALVGILCGMYPRLEMPIVESLRGGLPLRCLPHLLSEAGYRTAFLQTAPGQFENRPGLVRNLGYGHAAFGESLLRPGFERAGYLGLDEHAMLDPLLQWVGKEDDRPFFLTVLTVIPHHPYLVPGAVAGAGESFEQYLETIRHQDRFVGELLRGLERLGHADDTVVALFGDHGESFGEHGRRQHDAVPYQEVVRVPLLLVGPERAIGPPRRIGGLRSLLDLMPTVLEVAEIPWRGELPGRSLLGTPGHERVFSFCWFEDFCGAMREGDRAAVFHFGRRPTELYHLPDDPLQARPVNAQASAAELAAAERRIAAMELSIDELWKSQPTATGPPDWWREGP